MSAARAVIKDGELLLPHEAGCGAEVVSPGDARYDALARSAVRDEDLNGTAEQNATLAERWTRKWALEDRLTA